MDIDELMAQPEIRVAAMIVNTCRFDPLIVLHGYEGARRLERDSFEEATALRVAVARLIIDETEKANRG